MTKDKLNGNNGEPDTGSATADEPVLQTTRAQNGGQQTGIRQHRARGNVVLDPPIYTGYIAPGGFLDTSLACHALFHYFVTAASVYKREKEAIKYEGDKSRLNLHQLFLGIAGLYGVNPNDMPRYWPAVDLQAHALGLTKLPEFDLGVHWRDPRRGLI